MNKTDKNPFRELTLGGRQVISLTVRESLG